jgi:hypothetical protein
MASSSRKTYARRPEWRDWLRKTEDQYFLQIPRNLRFPGEDGCSWIARATCDATVDELKSKIEWLDNGMKDMRRERDALIAILNMTQPMAVMGERNVYSLLLPVDEDGTPIAPSLPYGAAHTESDSAERSQEAAFPSVVEGSRETCGSETRADEHIELWGHGGATFEVSVWQKCLTLAQAFG